MPGANRFHDLVRRLRAAPADGFAAHAVAALSEPLDWLDLVRGRLEEMTAGALVAGTRRVLVPGVEPKTFLLHDEPGRFRVVLNHFDRDSFECHRAEGRISPHFHRFSFATRMLRGDYHHMLFDNGGDLRSPRLSLWHHTKDVPGHVYYLPWDEFHCVLAPADGTMSLQIRTPVRYRAPQTRVAPPDRDLLVARDAALTALTEDPPGSPAAGTVPGFARRWLAEVAA
ncbi:hypothetical protein [Actinophytocola sp. KF-1]